MNNRHLKHLAERERREALDLLGKLRDSERALLLLELTPDRDVATIVRTRTLLAALVGAGLARFSSGTDRYSPVML